MVVVSLLFVDGGPLLCVVCCVLRFAWLLIVCCALIHDRCSLGVVC